MNLSLQGAEGEQIFKGEDGCIIQFRPKATIVGEVMARLAQRPSTARVEVKNAEKFQKEINYQLNKLALGTEVIKKGKIQAGSRNVVFRNLLCDGTYYLSIYTNYDQFDGKFNAD